MRKRVLITSALPYANGPLHFGHIAGAYLPADCYARFQRLMGNEVLYICGSDEHGVAITLSAELAKRSPKAHVDHFHAINQAFFEKLEFSFDFYGRTTWPGHVETTCRFFDDLNKKGFIEEKRTLQLYSESEKRFLADRYVVGTCPKCGFDGARGDECQKCAASYEATDLKNPRSKMSNAPLILKETDHFYLRFDKFQDELRAWIQKKHWKENVVNFAMRYIDDLKPRAITRDSDWGIPVPNHPGKVFYVWFDAPIGYVSIAQEWAQKQGKPDLWKDYWLDPETKFVQFLGKDNIPFHAVFFPAMLMGQDLPYKLPDELPANEFFLLEGRQFSKSDGWYLDLDTFFQKYTPDQARYAIAANAPESADSEFSWKDFQMRCNAELLGKFGNFVHRVLVFTKLHLGGTVPKLSKVDDLDTDFARKMELLTLTCRESYESFSLRRATQILMELASLGNGYFDLKKPWLLAKDPAQKEQLHTVLAQCIQCIQNLALLASPIIPASAQKIWQMLGYHTTLAKLHWNDITNQPVPAGQKIEEPAILFRKVEDEEILDAVSKLGSTQKPTTPFAPMKEPITFDQFTKLDLRVGEVLEAEKVPKSKKLLKLLVDIGLEKRTVVSGIALSYEPEQIVGKKFIFVINLAPATIMGIESRGMLLAGSNEAALELPQIQGLPPGSTVS